MGDLYWEVVRHLTLAQAAVVAPVNSAPHGADGTDACASPRFSYSDWEKTREDRWFEGQWVLQRIHYERIVTDSCDGSKTSEQKTEGPFRLWQAVPDARVADVNRPTGDEQAASGAPLRSSDPPGSGGPAKGPEAQAGQGTDVPENHSDSRKGPPYLPSLALLVAVLVAGLRHQRAGQGMDRGTSPDHEEIRTTSWWERMKGWASQKWEQAKTGWSGAKAWLHSIDWPKIGAYGWGFVKGAVVTGLAIGAIALVAGALSISTPVLLGTAALLVGAGAIIAYLDRRKQQVSRGIEPNGWKTAGVAALDALGLSGIIEGITERRMLTGESLDPEMAGESLGSGLVQAVLFTVGGRLIADGLGRAGAAATESLASRIGRSLSAWVTVSKAPETSLPGIWRILGVIGGRSWLWRNHGQAARSAARPHRASSRS